MIIDMTKTSQSSIVIKMKAREFSIPPITDALVVGIDAPIGSEALRRSISLLHGAPFDSIQTEDDVIDQIFVRSAIVKKTGRERLLEIVLTRIKPFMSPDEVIHLDISVELNLEEAI
jgi:hypothetical protein